MCVHAHARGCVCGGSGNLDLAGDGDRSSETLMTIIYSDGRKAVAERTERLRSLVPEVNMERYQFNSL